MEATLWKWLTVRSHLYIPEECVVIVASIGNAAVALHMHAHLSIFELHCQIHGAIYWGCGCTSSTMTVYPSGSIPANTNCLRCNRIYNIMYALWLTVGADCLVLSMHTIIGLALQFGLFDVPEASCNSQHYLSRQVNSISIMMREKRDVWRYKIHHYVHLNKIKSKLLANPHLPDSSMCTSSILVINYL